MEINLAILDYENFLQTLSGNQQWTYESAAKMLLDSVTYNQITGKDCDDCGNFKILTDGN